MSNTIPKWTDERVAQLVDLVDGESPVSASTVESVAEAMGTSTRSIASKLRNLDVEVESVVTVAKKAFSDTEAEELSAFIQSNSGDFTYAEIGASVCGGKFSTKQVQGKILSMELTSHVKPTPKQEEAKKYTEDETSQFIALAADGASLEAIAETLNKTLNSVRGKSLSLSRSVEDFVMPKQENSYAKSNTDALTDLGDVTDMTVEEIAKAIDKTDRGVKSMLTYRRLTCANYDGAKKAEKNEAAKAAKAA